MTDRNVKQLKWLPGLMAMVRQEVARRQESKHRDRPGLEAERDALNRKIKGWTESLAKTDLPKALRTTIEGESAAALARVEEIELQLQECQAETTQAERVIDESEVLDGLARLGDVLAGECPTLGNLMLSLHIDRIIARKDGRVVMRTCKLGSFPGALDLLRNAEEQGAASVAKESPTPEYQPKPRRRGRVRVDLGEDLDFDVVAAANMAVDPDRFTGLPDEWFWLDEFEIPGRALSWAAANSEAVFRRRQEGKFSYAQLAKEFGVTPPTARAAVMHFLNTHPDATDEVNLPRGGQRPPKFDLAKFGQEARALWESGWLKVKLAKKFACSAPTIDKALAWAYEQDGLSMPTRNDRKKVQADRARALLDAGGSLEEIADELKVSDVTARTLLKASFAAEGKPMPDLRCKRVRP